tara:strand:- start:117 stop:398 length:282 start_codon:yes stop_codon:yes gene_type:complete
LTPRQQVSVESLQLKAVEELHSENFIPAPILPQASVQAVLGVLDPRVVQKPPLLSQLSNPDSKEPVFPVKIKSRITKTTKAIMAVITIQKVFP